jgi:hypothetical protein
MSAKVKEALFELISSMTKSEKRYFKLMASRHTIGDENNYVMLFDHIDKQESYDETAIFNTFKGEAFLNRFSITKKRLYDHILQALDAYHASNSAEAQLYRQLHAAEILYEKSLYDQARRILKSAEKQAVKSESYAILQKISSLNKKLIENDGYADTSMEVIKEMFSKDMFYTEQISQHDHLWKIKSILFTKLRTKGVARTADERAEYEALIMGLPDLNEKSSFQNQYLFNHIHSALAFALQNTEKCSLYLLKNLELFQRNEQHLIEHFNTYISLLTNAIYVEESLGNRIRSNQLMCQLRELPDTYSTFVNEDLQIKLFASMNSVELGVLIKRGDLEQAAKLTAVIEKGLDSYDGKISASRQAFLAFKLATVHLGMGNYSEALRWINRILNEPELDPSEDILAFTYLIHLLIHLELKNDQLLPYAIKNTQRFLRSRNKMHAFEKVFINFIAKMIKCKDKFDAESLWQQLLYELKSLNGDGLEKAAMEYFDFKAWAEAKVKSKSFSEILKEKQLDHLKKAS